MCAYERRDLTGNVRVDGLAVSGASRGQVIVNSADPAYERGVRRGQPALGASESLFLRLVSYLAFAETVCVPARYVLQSDAAFGAMQLAQPLLEAGVLKPERRAETPSCGELALALGLPEAAFHRGAWLDATAASVRVFRSRNLSRDYREILLGDLAGDRGLRLALSPAVRRTSASGLDRAREAYAKAVDGTPEEFWRIVHQHAPAAGPTALRWAMARYYITPMLFDRLSTRELPRPAARLLVRGKAIPGTERPLDIPAPAEALYTRLTLQLPGYEVRARAGHFCEAILRVRDRLPEARRIFAEVQDRATLPPLTSDLRRLMDEEMKRQEGVASSSGFGWAIATSLGGAALGAIVGGDFAIAGVTGIASGAAAHAAGRRIEQRSDRRRRPWVTAVEHMTRSAATAGPGK